MWTTAQWPPAGAPATFSARLTGEIKIPAGVTQVGVGGPVKFRMTLDSKPIDVGYDSWASAPQGAHIGSYADGSALPTGRWVPVVVEYTSDGSIGGLSLQWTGGAVPASAVRPALGLATSSVSDDAGGVAGGKSVSQTSFSDASHGVEFGLATSSTVGGLTTTTSFEAPGSGWLRKTAKTLPAGNVTQYGYWGDAETSASACGTTGVNQGGLLKTRTDPDPDGSGPLASRVLNYVYDAAGRVAGVQLNADNWTCTSYDERGRVVKVVYPDGRSVSSSYSGLTSVVSDSSLPAANRSVTSVVDVLGRVVSYTDVWGVATSTAFSQTGTVAGRQVKSPAGAVVQSDAFRYDGAGRVVSQSLDGVEVAKGFVYDVDGRLASVRYANGVSGSFGVDSFGRDVQVRWGLASSVQVSDVVTRSQAGRIVDESVDGVDANPSGANFVYDAAGRLVEGWATPGPVGSGAHRYLYDFVSGNGCDASSPYAGFAAQKNTNRTVMTDVTVGSQAQVQYRYCYGFDDRLVSSSDPQVGVPSYDGWSGGVVSHGNVIGFGAAGQVQSLGYDGADRNVSVSRGGVTVSYVRDGSDRIVSRTQGSVVQRQGYTADGDTPDVVMDGSGNVLERTVVLPGGAMVTKRVAGGEVWSLPNVHGDVVALADVAGVKQGATLGYDPYGGSVQVPDNASGEMDYGWLGNHQRPLEHAAGLTPLVEMGARPYLPSLGRFLQIDPVDGGSANMYDYVAGDPLNGVDLDGRKRIRKVCGIATCSLYISRDWVKELCKKVCRYNNASSALVGGALASGCLVFGPSIVAAACGILAATLGSFMIDQIVYANSKNRCLRFRYVPLGNGQMGGLGLYIDNSKYCSSS